MASVEVTRRYRRERDEVSRSHGVRIASRHPRNGEHVCRRKAHTVKRSHAIEVSKCKSSTVSKRIRHTVAITEGGPHFASE